MLAASEATVTPRSHIRASRRAWMLGSAALLVFLVLAIGCCLTRRPWWDEGLFADVALNFRNHGHLGSTALDDSGYLLLPEVHHYTYWQFPFYFVALGSWLKFVPQNVIWMRFFSLFCALIYLLCWFVIVRKLSGSEPLAICVTSFLALDYEVLAAATDGRMEMMCATLGLAALAAFFLAEESNWTRAVFLGACFGAAALFTHPMGLLINIVLVVMVLLRPNEVRWKGVAAAGVPYVVGGALCFAYIMQAPHVFAMQFRSAEGFRVGGFAATVKNVVNDWQARYVYWNWTAASGILKAKIILLAFPVIAVFAVAIDRKLRKQRLGMLLLLLSIVGYLGVALIDNMKFPLYFVYSLTPMTACGALWIYARFHERGRFRFIATAAGVLFLLSSSLGVLFKIYRNEWRSIYAPAVNAIRAGLPPGGLLIGGSELGFSFGFGPSFVDDRYAGVISGRVPDVFVVNDLYAIARNAYSDRPYDAFEARLKNDYHEVLANNVYHVYFLNKNSPLKSSR
ncbi:MAG: hypothetical protein JO051_15915 [Acidobacteriaceae bacterium]|nr:hypothetical protein [Acidobacteriaceae bacterium]